MRTAEKRDALWYSVIGVYGNGATKNFPPSLIAPENLQTLQW